MSNLLFVPVHLDTLFLSQSQNVVGEKADFTQLPYVGNGQDHHADAPYLSEKILSQPFHNENLHLKAGMHLHWALPDAMTKSIGGTEHFPAVPNRWLISRWRNGQKEKAWVVESDYLFSADSGKLSGSISYPFPIKNVGDPPFRFLGRNMPWAAWKNVSEADEYLEKLTAVGYGEPTFAAFYPNCHSVFGFHDKEINQENIAGISYEITGWYSKADQDFIKQLQAAVISNSNKSLNLFELFEALEEASAWCIDIKIDKQTFISSDSSAASLWNDWVNRKWIKLIDEQTAQPIPPSQWEEAPDERTLSFMSRLLSPYFDLQTLCFSKLVFPEELPTQIEHPNFNSYDAKVTIANTGTEALSTYLSHSITTTLSPAQLEDQLEAVLLNSKLENRQIDIGPKFEEARHEKSFNAVHAGTRWVIRPHTDPHASAQADNVASQSERKLPAHLRPLLNDINVLQQALDQSQAEVIALKNRLFSDWCQYLRAAYPSEGTHEKFIPADELKYFIEQKDLPQLEQKQLHTGKLVCKEDQYKRITEVASIEGGPNCLAQQVASGIHQIIEALKAFNRTGGLLLALKLSQKSAENTTRDDSGHEKTGQFLGNVSIVDDDQFHQVTAFNGQDSSLKSPNLEGTKSISFWVHIPASGNGCLIDAGNNLDLTSSSVGSNWESLYVDAEKVAPINWHAIPKGKWTHIYLVYKQPTNGFIHLMSRSNQSEFLEGRLAHIHVYDYELTKDEIQKDSKHFIRQQYILQSSLAPRYWQAKEPVALISGKIVEASPRHGFDGKHREDDKLHCFSWHGVGINDLINSDFQQIHAKLSDLKNQYPEDHFAFDIWQHQPWHPLNLEWQVIIAPLANKSNADRGVRKYASDFITSNYQLLENAADLSVKPGKFRLKNLAYEYTGSSILTPYANVQLKDRLEKYLKNQLSHAYEQRQSADETQSLANLNEYISWYQTNHCTEGNEDAICSLIEAYELLSSGNIHTLAQSLGGFNDALLMHQLVMQLPVADPLGFPAYQDFAQKVAKALGKDIRSAPLPDYDYNPIRSGVMRINQLKLIDTFGRTRSLYHGDLLKSHRMNVPGRDDMVFLPPRIVQASRLNFRWLAAEQNGQEMNEDPTTHPICGWFLANHLDHSVMVYDQFGKLRCSISQSSDPAYILRHPPGPRAGEPYRLSETLNEHLRNTLNYIVERTRHNPNFLQHFVEVIDSSLTNIDPANYAQHTDLAMLMSRPIALVRVSLNLELEGLPTNNHDGSVLKQDLARNTREDEEFTNVDFPIRLGEYKQLNDGLVGYWIEDSNAFKNHQFFAPQSDEVEEEFIITRSESDFTLCQSLSAAPQILSLLFDPRGKIHATSGILPTKAIDIPPEQYVDAIKQIEVTFLSSPLLSDSQQVQIPLPAESGYQWSWLAKTEGAWNEIFVPGIVKKHAFHQAFPDQAEEVWAMLSNQTTQWINPLDTDQAEILNVDQRGTQQLPEPWTQHQGQIEAILAQFSLGQASLTADLHGTNIIREGWLKLKQTSE